MSGFLAKTFACAVAVTTLGACSTPPVVEPSAPTPGDTPLSPSRQVTLAPPEGRLREPSPEETLARQRASFAAEIERRVAARAEPSTGGTPPADGSRVAAQAVLDGLAPSVLACAREVGAREELADRVDLTVVLNPFDLADAWLTVRDDTPLPVEFADCAAKVVWVATWPNVGVLSSFSAPLARADE